MPRVQRRIKRRKDTLSKSDVRMLFRGSKFFCDDGRWQPLHAELSAKDREWQLHDMRETWEAMRDELLAEWIAENPGTRPWAWWKWDALERRLCMNGEHPFDLAAYPDKYKHLSFGKPRCSAIVKDDQLCEWESEYDYLDRLILLTPDERQAYAA